MFSLFSLVGVGEDSLVPICLSKVLFLNSSHKSGSSLDWSGPDSIDWTSDKLWPRPREKLNHHTGFRTISHRNQTNSHHHPEGPRWRLSVWKRLQGHSKKLWGATEPRPTVNERRNCARQRWIFPEVVILPKPPWARESISMKIMKNINTKPSFQQSAGISGLGFVQRSRDHHREEAGVNESWKRTKTETTAHIFVGWWPKTHPGDPECVGKHTTGFIKYLLLMAQIIFRSISILKYTVCVVVTPTNSKPACPYCKCKLLQK